MPGWFDYSLLEWYRDEPGIQIGTHNMSHNIGGDLAKLYQGGDAAKLITIF